MEYVVYIDIIFLTDFFLNFLALFLAAVLLRRNVSLLWTALAAMIGSIWNCALILFPAISVQQGLFITVFGIGSLMTTVSLRLDRKKLCISDFATEVIRADAALFLSSALLSGCLSFSREHFYLTDWEALTFPGAITGAAGVFLRTLMKTGRIGTERYAVRLYMGGKGKDFTALADSGNRLCVPETGKPVSLISYQDCIGFCERVSGGFFIPYRAVGTDHGLLFAMTFEKMEIKKGGMCITIENPAVAIVKESLSSNSNFNMLLPEEYVTEISDCSSRRRKSK